MWETPFEESMLNDPVSLAIHCPDEYLAEELFEIFKQNKIGINWDSLGNTRWYEYSYDTTYYVCGKVMLYGPKRHGDDVRPYCDYTKCTFYGGADHLRDVEIDEEEFLAMLNV